jgi:hypothetical protein
MSEILHINTEQARHDPETAFSSPAELAASNGLNRGQKIATLERWAQQILDRLRAGSEGMPTHRTSPADIATLEAINVELARLKSGADTPSA